MFGFRNCCLCGWTPWGGLFLLATFLTIILVPRMLIIFFSYFIQDQTFHKHVECVRLSCLSRLCRTSLISLKFFSHFLYMLFTWSCNRIFNTQKESRCTSQPKCYHNDCCLKMYLYTIFGFVLLHMYHKSYVRNFSSGLGWFLASIWTTKTLMTFHAKKRKKIKVDRFLLWAHCQFSKCF